MIGDDDDDERMGSSESSWITLKMVRSLGGC